MNFSEFNFHADIAKGVKIAGFKEPSPIQELAIPIVMGGSDMVGQAHTGTGKTAAFGLPILDRLAKGEIERALVITPTRELATQVADELYHLGRFAGIRTLTVYGGVGYGRQIALIHKGVQIVVATPGRLKDLYKKGKIDSFNPEIVVLDEADEMLDMGFLDEIKEIFEYIPQNRQTLLFSATMPEPIKELASHILYMPEFISAVGEDETTNNVIDQRYYMIHEHQRDDAIIRLLETEETNKCIIFCRMKREVDRLAEHLNALGFSASGLHGDLEQSEREVVIKAYRRGETKIMVATDVAARGLDVKDVTHVFNYHIPFDPQSYVHRIGRTGRAGKSGQAITLVTTEEFKELQRIQKEVGAEMRLATIQGHGGLDEAGFEYLAEQIRDIPVHGDAATLLGYMKEMDTTLLLEKLLSRLIEQEQHQFSTQIGFDQDTVDEMMEDYSTEQKETRGSNRRRKRR
ncbi:MAG TPA: DEAD/DEAH box helicase [Sulfurovum sp.]|nr:MAG: DEAD/DEAH box helicase [Sulfurovum sp. 35-42-20]OYZ26615.1 MAG: DEAD/DEAH box helicase [Sulfurovum sp. 16-42-52]OYZ48715.1 MAG: DEAD/DEAH box helicase [Sulfurovum sp. 24-42-9]OZA47102.1 MAG: DEAD/DEAH box helicase [Sulfurovum sp. 17-42-90]OZA59513.1 MAG: DEAD/DEAH box helicase [Sulfurovum sp. 39-42-12]HQR73961.1 DEAD/DEAH box helicase [Sulfurovum sp.]